MCTYYIFINLIDINKEIEQVKSFVEIEKARFGELLTVSYDIEDVNIKIPSLIIQPLVENAIIHGILESGRAGVVKISIKKLPYSLENTVRISIEDNGIGISEEIINNVYQDNMPENKIGLYNVHLRLKLMYGRGLNIRRIDNGTLIVFYVKE
ncbi:ATP-binding protein [Clostridioides difficile]|uniref:ATP-binding protein n=1 Tax=Clostridioides difficile TaxID=1496 RepID=UPI002FCDC0EA